MYKVFKMAQAKYAQEGTLMLQLAGVYKIIDNLS